MTETSTSIVAGVPLRRRASARARAPSRRPRALDVAERLAKRLGAEVDPVCVRMIAVGSRGHGPVRRALLGSVSAALAATAPCPVLVVPPTAAALEPAGPPAQASISPRRIA